LNDFPDVKTFSLGRYAQVGFDTKKLWLRGSFLPPDVHITFSFGVSSGVPDLHLTRNLPGGLQLHVTVLKITPRAPGRLAEEVLQAVHSTMLAALVEIGPKGLAEVEGVGTHAQASS